MKNHKGLISVIIIVIVAIIVIFGGVKMHQHHQAAVKREQATSMIKDSNAGKKAIDVLDNNSNQNSNTILASINGGPNNQRSVGNTVYLMVNPPFQDNKSQQAYLAQAAWDRDFKWFSNFSKQNPARIIIQGVSGSTIATGTTKSSKLNLKCRPEYTSDVKYLKDTASQIAGAQTKKSTKEAHAKADKQNAKSAKYAYKKASKDLNDPKKFKKSVDKM